MQLKCYAAVLPSDSTIVSTEFPPASNVRCCVPNTTLAAPGERPAEKPDLSSRKLPLQLALRSKICKQILKLPWRGRIVRLLDAVV